MSQVEQVPEISKVEFVEWSKSRVTRFIHKELTTLSEDYIDSVRSEVRSGDLSKASYYEGIIAGLATILNIEYEDIPNES